MGPIAGAAAAFILSMLASSFNFLVDGLEEGVIRKASSCQLVEPMGNCVGIHVGFEFS